MKQGRIMNQPADYQKLGIDPHHLAAWEDGRRDNSEPGHSEIWYFDCSFDDQSTLVLGFRPKSVAQVNSDHDNPNVAINYSHPDGKPFYDYRLYDIKDTKTSTKDADLKWGPSSLQGHDWQDYDVHIEPEADQEIVMEGKKSVHHQTALDLHFEAEVKPFRPGTGYITFGPDDQFYYNFICITKLKVTGKISIDGESKAVSGSAYYNHQWSNISPMNAFHHWIWGRQNIGKYNVLIYDMVGADRFGDPQIPLMTIDDDQGNRVFENVTADNTKFEVLDTYQQANTGKTMPSKMRYTFDQGDKKVEYVIYDPKEINNIDFYTNAPEETKKKFDQMNMQPTYTRYLAKTELTITIDGKSETIDGTMLYEMNFPAKSL